jgi:hypothetical protein
VIVRIGTPLPGGRLAAGLGRLGVPMLISANALWRRGRFRLPTEADLGGADIALDSAGFVAWAHYGRYRWTVEQYVSLAGGWPWSWWAAMDACCEPEIASDHSEVRRRVLWTADSLVRCNEAADAAGVQRPVPVLQGWSSDDYARSAELTDRALCGEWPGLVAVGSVCRRALSGQAGLWAVLERIALELPAGVGLHLFGVKGSAIPALETVQGVHSTDSQAWDYAARIDARKRGISNTVEHRLGHAQRWLERQQPQQLSLWG